MRGLPCLQVCGLDAHIDAWKRIVDYVHGSNAKMALQFDTLARKVQRIPGWQEIDEPCPKATGRRFGRIRMAHRIVPCHDPTIWTG
jgi:2,4-dienoyl-CoA reductase-like NADH-dependent reductase (Old Yellow Enzyme family)